MSTAEQSPPVESIDEPSVESAASVEPVEPESPGLDLTPDEPIPPRSRTFSAQVVKAVNDYLTGANGEPVKNLGVGTFDTEGAARSALHSLNRMLRELHNAPHTYGGTVRETDDGRYRAIILNQPAKVRTPKAAKGAKSAPKS